MGLSSDCTKTTDCSSSAISLLKSICTPIRWTTTRWDRSLRNYSANSRRCPTKPAGNTTRRGMSYGYWSHCCLRNTSEDLSGQGIIRSIFDPCCGTGGMLTIGKEYFRKEINPDANIRLLGQELNAQTYAICKSDMLITRRGP